MEQLIHTLHFMVQDGENRKILLHNPNAMTEINPEIVEVLKKSLAIITNVKPDPPSRKEQTLRVTRMLGTVLSNLTKDLDGAFLADQMGLCESIKVLNNRMPNEQRIGNYNFILNF